MPPSTNAKTTNTQASPQPNGDGASAAKTAIPPIPNAGQPYPSANPSQGGAAGDSQGQHNQHPKQFDIPNGERQCYFGEVPSERGTYWAQFLIRMNDKVSVMVDTKDLCLISCSLLAGNAKLFFNRPITKVETHRSIAGEDTIVIFTRGGSGAANHVVMQYNRV